MNLHTYVGNDPLNVTDPTGKVRRHLFRFLTEPVRTVGQAIKKAARSRVKGDRDRQPSDADWVDSEIPEVPEEFSEPRYKPESSGGDGAGKPFSRGVKELSSIGSRTCIFCDEDTTNAPGNRIARK